MLDGLDEGPVGISVGCLEGPLVGYDAGCAVGKMDRCEDGEDGRLEGSEFGCEDGCIVGR